MFVFSDKCFEVIAFGISNHSVNTSGLSFKESFVLMRIVKSENGFQERALFLL